MNTFKTVITGLLLVIFILAGIFVLEYVGIEFTRFFGPRRMEVQREIFEENPSRVHGLTQELIDYRLEYNRADDDIEREAIADTIRQRYNNFDPEWINDYELRQFLRNMMSGNY